MAPPQYFLSSVFIGSLPIIVDDTAAVQTRPSVESRQVAGFESLTARQSFLTSFANASCLLNQSEIDFVLD